MTTSYLQNLFALAEVMPVASKMLDHAGFKLHTMTAAYVDSLRPRNKEWERCYIEFASLREREWFALRSNSGSHWPTGRNDLPDDQRSDYVDRLVREFGQLSASTTGDFSRISETVDPNAAIYLAQPVKDTNAWRRHLADVRRQRDAEVDLICECRSCNRDAKLTPAAMLRRLERLASYFPELQVSTTKGRRACFVVELAISDDFALQVHWDDPYTFSSSGNLPLLLRPVIKQAQTSVQVSNRSVVVNTTFDRLLPGFRFYFEHGCDSDGRFTLAMSAAFSALRLIALSLRRTER